MSLEQIEAFLKGSSDVEFKGKDRKEVYGWANETLRGQQYEGLKRKERGLVKRYVEKMTGQSRAQTTRLIAMYMEGEEVKPRAYRRRRFANSAPGLRNRSGRRIAPGASASTRD